MRFNEKAQSPVIIILLIIGVLAILIGIFLLTEGNTNGIPVVGVGLILTGFGSKFSVNIPLLGEVQIGLGGILLLGWMILTQTVSSPEVIW